LVNAAATTAFARALRAEAQRLGFAACGFAPAAENPLTAHRLEQWLGEGLHGSMDWMDTRLHHRRSPQGLWPEAGSVIALGMSYAPAADPLALADHPDRARISIYAQGGDYHDTVKKGLKALARWIVAEAPEGRAGRGRGQGFRRYRTRDGKAAGAGRRAGLAGQAHQPW